MNAILRSNYYTSNVNTLRENNLSPPLDPLSLPEIIQPRLIPLDGKRPLVKTTWLKGPIIKKQLRAWQYKFQTNSWVVLTGNRYKDNWLYVLDIDRPELFRFAIPSNYYVLTGKGVHHYFFVKEELPFEQGKIVINDQHAGDLICNPNSYVVAPYSLHANGNIYAPSETFHQTGGICFTNPKQVKIALCYVKIRVTRNVVKPVVPDSTESLSIQGNTTIPAKWSKKHRIIPENARDMQKSGREKVRCKNKHRDKRIMELSDSGMSIRATGVEVGVSKSTVARVLVGNKPETTFYCTSTLKIKTILKGYFMARNRMTKKDVTILEDQIYEALENDHPQSIRHVFYLMTNPTLEIPVQKNEAGYIQVQRRIKYMRQSARILYGWITDATRRGWHTPTFSDAGEMIHAYAGLYRANLWRRSEYYVEVWCESRSIAGTIEKDCRELAVSLYPCGGFASMTLIYEGAEEIKRQFQSKDNIQIFYIGDYDPSGLWIDKKIESGLMEHLSFIQECISFNRIAITEQQIRDLNLPTKPRKETDRRRLDIRETVEAEAMPAHYLRKLLRDKIEALLPHGELKVIQAAEQSEQEGLLMLGNRISQDGLNSIIK